MSWNIDHAAAQSSAVSASMRAGARGRIGDARQVRFFQKNKLRVARDAARKSVGQAERRGMRQHRDGVGAAEAGGGDRDRGAQHVHVRIAPRHHAPRRLGGDDQPVLA